MPSTIKIITSMASKSFLLDAAQQYGSGTLDIIAAGGVDVAKRVKSGEAVDAVVLASNAIDELVAAGKIVPGSKVDLVSSPIAIAVRKGGPAYDISSEMAVKNAALTAGSVGYSTGASGVHIEKLLARWGATSSVKAVQAPPGTPVGTLLARGDVALGFQQLSEMIHVTGIDILGPMPPELQLVTTFSAGVSVTCTQREVVNAALSYLTSPAMLDIKRKNGLDPA
jgi:molybdate transport system substrate-binding protein